VAQRPHSYSLQNYLDASTSRPALYNLVRAELPVRLASLIASLPSLLPEEVKEQREGQFIQDYCEISFQEVEKFPLSIPAIDHPIELGLEKQWLKALNMIDIRLAGTTQMLSEAILNSGVLSDSSKYEHLQLSLPQIFRQNISVDVLVNVYQPKWTKHLPTCIDPSNDILVDAKSAYDDARLLCEENYISSPELQVNSSQASTVFPSIPTYNYLILFEIFKNALRATVEEHGEEDETTLPSVELLLRDQQEKLVLQVVDSGKGMSQEDLRRCKRFFTSSAVLGGPTGYMGAHSSPLAGHGFGLGMASVYCGFWGGALEVESEEGRGTTVSIEWCRDATLAKENVF